MPTKSASKDGAKKAKAAPKRAAKKTASAPGAAARYEAKKEHQGKKYSGMKIGGIHRWDYRDGTWHEKKLGTSRWEFNYASNKHRKSRAPSGSGAGVGSGFHWLIVAHQWVEKTDANTYATLMEGEKHLLGFRKPDWKAWNTQFRNQKSARQRMIKVLRETLDALEAEDAAESIEEPWQHPSFGRLGVTKAAEDVVRKLVPEEILATEAQGA